MLKRANAVLVSSTASRAIGVGGEALAGLSR
jgi:hypothetical protein